MTKSLYISLIVIYVLFSFQSTAAQPKPAAVDEFVLQTKSNTPAELATKAQLERLMKTYNVSPWIFTKRVVIDEKERIPHSHPVLTLSIRHLKDDELLLSTFIHEQLHWFMNQDEKARDAAVAEFRTMFPKVPTGGPEGARDENSTYLHIAVCYLEYRAIRELMGELRSRQIIDFWANDHYRWIYRTVRDQTRDIGQVMFKHRLVPAES